MMSDEGPLKTKHVRELQMSHTTPGAALKRINELLFPYMVAKVKSCDSSYWLPTTVWFCGLLSGADPPINEVLESRVVPALLLSLTVENYPELQVEAAKALKYLASGTSEVTKLIIDQAGVAKALTNIAFGTSDVTKVAIVQAANSTHDALRHLLYSKDNRVLRHACCYLAVLSGCKNVRISQLIRESGLYHRLLELTRHPTLVGAALRTLGNIVVGDESLIECIIRDNVLAHLRSCLGHSNVDVRKETCWIISYIAAAGNGRCIQSVIEAGLIKLLVHAVNHDEFVVMEAAVWAISNATSGATSEQIRFMCSEKCIETLCHLFCCRDSEIFNVCLEGIENILKAGEGEKSNVSEVNPYVEHMRSIRGWTVLEVSGRRYEKELFKKALKIMVTYGTMSLSSYKKHLSSDSPYDYNGDYYTSGEE